MTALAIERYKGDRALRESEERLRIAQQAGRVGTFELFPERGRIAVSEEFCRQWGLPVLAEFDIVELIALVHPQDRARVLTGDPDIPSGALDYLEYRIRRPDNGEERWMGRRGEAVDSAFGKRYLGVSYDITDHKRVEERLRVSEAQLRRLNDSLAAEVEARTRERDRIWRNSRDLFIVASEDGVLRAVNPAWTVDSRLPEDELIGRSFADIVHPDDVEATRAALDAAIGAGFARFENRNRAQGRLARAGCRGSVTQEGDALYGNGRDITREKETQRALRQTEETLRQAQKMEALGQLTGGIAHDFNNLLQGITGPLELIRRFVQLGRIDEIDRFIAMAIGAANRAASLTHRLLAFSRRQPLDPKPVNADELLNSIDDLLRRTMGEAIEREGDPQRPSLAHPLRREPARKRAAQFRDQRARRDARRRPPHARNRQRGTRRRFRRASSGCACRDRTWWCRCRTRAAA